MSVWKLTVREDARSIMGWKASAFCEERGDVLSVDAGSEDGARSMLRDYVLSVDRDKEVQFVDSPKD